jgi:AraC-like DNA-binding protein
MTITIPNYLIEQKEPTLIKLNEGLYLERMHTPTQKTLVRSTMHGLTLIESGTKEVELEGQRYHIAKDHAVFFSQGNYFTNQNTPDYRALTIFFDDDYLLQLIGKYALQTSQQSCSTLVLPFGNEEKIIRLTQNIVSTHTKKCSHRITLLTLQVELLILELFTAFPRTGTFFRHILDTSGERMRYILESNIDILHTVSDMQKLLRMGTTTFHQHFRRQFGISPKTWLDTQRMKKAMFLLTSTDKSITEVATECGYATASWFIVQFKKYCKTTPKEYRVKNRYK